MLQNEHAVEKVAVCLPVREVLIKGKRRQERTGDERQDHDNEHELWKYTQKTQLEEASWPRM